MDVAGVVLGALPIAMSAVQCYINGPKPIKCYKNYSQTLKGIHRNLFVQEEQLRDTLERIGLTKSMKPTLLEVQQKLREHKPECSDQFIDILEHMGSITSVLMDKLEIDSKGKPQWTDEMPERVSWEWRRVKRSFGDKYRKELFDELQYWNTALRNCLEPRREISSDHADPMIAELVRLFNLKSCDEARDNVRMVHRALAEAWSKCNDHQHPSNVELIWQQTGLKETGQLQLSIPALGGNGTDKHWQKVSINIDQRRRTPTSNLPNVSSATNAVPDSLSVAPSARKPRSTGRLRNMIPLDLKSGKLLVVPLMQVTSLQSKPLGCNQDETPDSQLITGLCNLMNHEDWNGYLLHPDIANEKVIYMKRVLSPCSKFSSRSLEAVISNPHDGSSKGKQVANVRLSRKERLGVAAGAVWAVLILCGTPWLEERWLGKEDITLLVEVLAQGNRFDRPKTYPSLSHTFASQQETANKRPENHSPNDYPNSQIRHKTLFALGILLIELGLNKTFQQIRADSNTGGSTWNTSVQDDYITAKQVIDSEVLELELGESYANAVQRCIQCHFLGSESTQNFLYSGFRKQFFIGVVAPVQATFDAQITSIHSL